MRIKLNKKMAKEDFCFTYYDGDAARDMAHMNRTERGAYTDIIISQRKFGRLTLLQIKKILGKDFEECWTSIELVLKNEDEKFFIEWLENSINKKKAHSKFQSENGKKGGRPSKINPNESELKPTESKLKANQKVAFDLAFQNESEIKPLGNGNENENEYGNEYKEGYGNENFSGLIGPEMVRIFKSKNPNYPVDDKLDYSACLQMAFKIGVSAGWTQNEVIGKNKADILEMWGKIIDFVSSDKWFSTRSITDLNKEWQRLIQTINNGHPNNNNSKGPSSRVTGQQLDEAFADFYSRK